MDETATTSGTAGSVLPARRGLTAPVAEILLLSLAAGQMFRLWVLGAMATATDLLVGALVGAWLVDLARSGDPGRGFRPPDLAAGRRLPAPSFLVGVGALLAFGALMAASGLWGSHPGYALAKGAGAAGLALAAGALGLSGLSWRRAVDAWLAGAGFALLLSAILFFAGPAGRAAVVYEHGGVSGLPFPRLRGPLVHPSTLGDYLVVSGLLLWARWPSLGRAGKGWGAALGVGLAVGLVLSASTAWGGAGVVVALAAFHGGPTLPRMAVALAAVGFSAVSLLAVVGSVDASVEGVHLVTSGLRPEIWKGALNAFETAPLAGVGAAPYLARAVDPLAPGAGPVLWDAHNLYLSILGQLGLVGMALFGSGVALAALAGLRSLASRRERVGMGLVWVALGVNAVFTASEDLRHLWMAVGLLGLLGASGPGKETDAGEPVEPGVTA